MNEIVPFRTEVLSRAFAQQANLALNPAPNPAQNSPRVNETLGLIAQTAEKMRDLHTAREAADARADSAFEQMRRDRVEWQSIWENIRRETAECQQKLSATEGELEEARREIQALRRRCGDTEARESAATARAEAAEQRARGAEEWLSRLQDAVVAEFTTIIDRAAS